MFATRLKIATLLLFLVSVFGLGTNTFIYAMTAAEKNNAKGPSEQKTDVQDQARVETQAKTTSPPKPVATDADQSAAEWMIDNGGLVQTMTGSFKKCWIGLWGTKVTDSGVKGLQTALPICTIKNVDPKNDRPPPPAATALSVQRDKPLQIPKEGAFVIHEWGTFSTFSGSDGQALKFLPNDSDLPQFVHTRHRNVKGGVADSYVSLETPVLYFYTDRDRLVSVQVDFPKGIMTDWYPEASRPPTQQLRWDDLRVLAKDHPTLLVEQGPTRYYAAREVDAASVKTAVQDNNRESEKFLFYRGVGDFLMPFQVRALGQGKFAVKNTGKQMIPGHFLVNVSEDRKVSFKSLGKLLPNVEENVELPADVSTIEKLSDAMSSLLMEQGLYEKEAKAMVKTWKSDWFGEPGTRVLYLVSESLTAELLPLKIKPKPDTMIRVLVGRHDVLTPEREREIDVLVKRLTGDSNVEAKAADAILNKLGRYRTAAQMAAEKRMR